MTLLLSDWFERSVVVLKGGCRHKLCVNEYKTNMRTYTVTGRRCHGWTQTFVQVGYGRKPET